MLAIVKYQPITFNLDVQNNKIKIAISVFADLSFIFQKSFLFDKSHLFEILISGGNAIE